jgi:hypothetical protein
LEFWETIEGIGNKVPEILNSLKELSKNEKIQESLGNAGTIGNLCLIGFEIYKQIKKDLQTPEKEAFGALINIVFEVTKEVLPQNDKPAMLCQP